jgi:hypothetical protein
MICKCGEIMRRIQTSSGVYWICAKCNEVKIESSQPSV